MIKMSDYITVPAGETSDNVLAGRTGRLVTRPSAVKLWVTTPAKGVRQAFRASASVLLDDESVKAVDRDPDLNSDLAYIGGVKGGRELSLRFRNTTNADAVVSWVLHHDPVA